uniref:Uncharacterized protein n=1 Tax=Piliocolobus tephrosceles TaxID=591936 RepID=A0A8C9HLG8_9PRIM
LSPNPHRHTLRQAPPVSINSNLLGYIGIDTIIEQMRKKTMKTGFDFNIMVVERLGWIPLAMLLQYPAVILFHTGYCNIL